MSLPGIYSPTEPQAGETVASGPAKLQANFQALADFLGIPPAPTSLTGAAFSITSAGVVTIQQAGALLTADPTAPLGIATKEYADAKLYNGTSAGGPTAYTVVLSPVPATLAALQDIPIWVEIEVANTGASTLAPNGLAVTPIRKYVGSTIVELASGDLQPGLVALGYDGTQFLLLTVSSQGQGQGVGLSGARNLYTSAAGAGTTLNITADLLVTRNNTAGALAFFNNFNATIDISTAGPILNGRDQAGAFGATATVHVYAISGSGQTVGLIASLTAPSAGGPTLPANYTNWAYLTTLILAGGNFQNVQVVGDKVYYAARIATPLANGQATVETAVSLAGLVPANIAQAAILQVEGSVTTSAGVNFNQGTLNIRVVSGADFFLLKPTGYSVGAHTMQQDVIIEIPNLNQFFYLWSVAPNAVGFGASAWITGYRVPNGA